MKVKGILIQSEGGEEFLVTALETRLAASPAFRVERRKEGRWISAQLPARQSLAITAVALLGMNSVAERCGLKLTGLVSHLCESQAEYIPESLASRGLPSM